MTAVRRLLLRSFPPLLIAVLLQLPATSAPEAKPPTPSIRQLVSLIQDIPAVSTGRVVYEAKDDLGEPLSLLDPIPDPRGGYLGVYDFSTGGTSPAVFVVALAHSSDLIHWRRLAIIDRGANSPTLRPIPGGTGYLFADERYSAADPYDHVRVRFYRSLNAVLDNQVSAQADLPRRYSPYAEGTPDFLSIAWHGGLRRSVLELGFHYLPVADNPGHQGPDREALGILRGFRTWTTRKDPVVDRLLDGVGLAGAHGDSRQFRFAEETWRVYEAQASYVLGGFANWRIVLFDPALRRMYPLTMMTGKGRFSRSLGVPIVNVERAPTGHGTVLVVTMFVLGLMSMES